jgi:hypothetical protein
MWSNFFFKTYSPGFISPFELIIGSSAARKSHFFTYPLLSLPPLENFLLLFSNKNFSVLFVSRSFLLVCTSQQKSARYKSLCNAETALVATASEYVYP